MRYKRVLFVILSAMALALLLPAVVLAQTTPHFPARYSGTVVTEAGDPAPDGAEVYAMIKDYQSTSVAVADGSYANLKVAPPRIATGQSVTFYVDVDGSGPLEPVLAATSVSVTFAEWVGYPGEPSGTVNLTYTPPELPAAGIPALPTIMMWLGIGGAFALALGLLIWRRSRQMVTAN